MGNNVCLNFVLSLKVMLENQPLNINIYVTDLIYSLPTFVFFVWCKGQTLVFSHSVLTVFPLA